MALTVKEHPKGGFAVYDGGTLITRTPERKVAVAFAKGHPNEKEG